jgi:hypothetical protein
VGSLAYVQSWRVDFNPEDQGQGALSFVVGVPLSSNNLHDLLWICLPISLARC